jgi:hypothetical protein
MSTFWHKHLLLVICVLAVMPRASIVNAQESEDRVRAIARKSVGEAGFLSVHRREDLEEVFHSVSPKGTPQMFEIANEGYDFKKDAVGYQFSVHGPSVRFVAVDSQTGRAFRISGFRDAQNEFNGLAESYQVKLGDELQARRYANLYLQLDPLHDQINPIQSLLSLKYLAERRFSEINKDFATAEPQFQRWWTKHESALARLPLEEKIVATEKGFVLTFVTLSGVDKHQPDRGPSPLKVTLTLSKDGQVDAPTFTPIALD